MFSKNAFRRIFRVDTKPVGGETQGAKHEFSARCLGVFPSDAGFLFVQTPLQNVAEKWWRKPRCNATHNSS